MDELRREVIREHETESAGSCIRVDGAQNSLKFGPTV